MKNFQYSEFLSGLIGVGIATLFWLLLMQTDLKMGNFAFDLITACEETLPRDQNCIITAVPWELKP